MLQTGLQLLSSTIVDPFPCSICTSRNPASRWPLHLLQPNEFDLFKGHSFLCLQESESDWKMGQPSGWPIVKKKGVERKQLRMVAAQKQTMNSTDQ